MGALGRFGRLLRKRMACEGVIPDDQLYLAAAERQMNEVCSF
jgi:hypothetical protein